MDLLPTFLTATKREVSDELYLDGVDLLPYLKGEKQQSPHDTLFWMTHNQGAVRAGEWKMIFSSATDVQLFNLKNDLSEEENVADKYPDIVQQLLVDWKNWNEPFPLSASEQKKFDLD